MRHTLHCFILIMVAACFTASCSTKQINEQPALEMSTPEVPPFDYPATFTGTIPCNDCLRVDIILNIRPDGLYQLRKTYQAEQGSASIASQMGKWRYISDGNFLILGKEMGLLKTYVVEDRSRLTFVEWEGTENKSQIRYELTRSDPAPFDDVVKIRGMFGVVNGVATLNECASQVTFPVSPSGDYNSTLQNYMNTPHDMNKSILISILGRLVQHDQEELVIEQFRKFYPNSDCQGNKIKTSLTGTHWQVLETQNRKWSEITDKIAHLLLKRDKTIEGFSGCNKISGTYLVKGDVLLIKRELVSRKACPGGMEGENLLVSVLDDAESYRIEGNILELIDQNDQVLARFLAGP